MRATFPGADPVLFEEATPMLNRKYILNQGFAAFAAGLIAAASPAFAVDFMEGWTRVDSPPPHQENVDFINSGTIVENGSLKTDVVEAYYVGTDGNVYVDVVYNNALIGSFLTEYTSLPNNSDFTGWSPPSESAYNAITSGESGGGGGEEGGGDSPEPATWALMLLGLGLTGARLRRRWRTNGAITEGRS